MTSVHTNITPIANQTHADVNPKPLNTEVCQFENLLTAENISYTAPELSKLLSSITPQLQDPSLMARDVIDLYPLHAKLIKISKLIRELNNTEISNGWLLLLSSLSDHKFPLRSGGTIRPWIDRIITYFNTGERETVTIKVLTPESFSPSNVKEISKIAYASFRSGYSDELLNAMLSATNTVCVVAQDAQAKLLGFAFGFAGQITPGHQAFHLDSLARTPDTPSLGIGHQLMEKVEEVVKSRFDGNIQTINLNTQTHNKIAQRLYKSHGFEKVGSIIGQEYMIKKLKLTADSNTAVEVRLFKAKLVTKLVTKLLPIPKHDQAEKISKYQLFYDTALGIARLALYVAKSGWMKVGDLVGWNRYFDFSV